jgi:hypothetical protein
LVEFFVRERVAVAGFVVVRRQLMEELFDAVLFAERVDVRYFLFGYRREILMDLVGFETGRHPGVLFESTARVVVVRGRLSVTQV